MKAGAHRHRKMKRLARALEIPRVHAVGLVEMLIQATAEHTWRGDIGCLTDIEIAEETGWAGNADSFVAALKDTGWIDPHPVHRFVFHDWPDHAADYIRKRVARSGRGWAVDDTELHNIDVGSEQHDLGVDLGVDPGIDSTDVTGDFRGETPQPSAEGEPECVSDNVCQSLPLGPDSGGQSLPTKPWEGKAILSQGISLVGNPESDGQDTQDVGQGGERAKSVPPKTPARPREPDPSSEAVELATTLWAGVRGAFPTHRKPSKAALRGWCVAIDRAIRLDGRDPPQLHAVIDWLFAERPSPQAAFWQKNVRSGQKLREHFDRLEAEMASEANRPPRRPDGKPQHPVAAAADQLRRKLGVPVEG
jgi:hypothetical protein